jgi:hypothetical protein
MKTREKRYAIKTNRRQSIHGDKYKKLIDYIYSNDEIPVDDLIRFMYLSGWTKRQVINYFSLINNLDLKLDDDNYDM